MSYEAKMVEARRVLEAHNAALGEGEENKVNIDGFIATLRVNGGTSVEGLRTCSFEDLESFGLPRLLARSIATMFRRWDGEERQSPAYISSKKAAQMSKKELLQNYDLREPENAVGQRLLALSKGFPFIALNDDGSVCVDLSVTLLDDLRDGQGPRDVCLVNGRPKPIYRVGERPEGLADENPLYPGRALRSDGTCDQTNRSWDGVSQVIRTLLYIAVKDTDEVSIRSLDDAHVKMDLALGENAESVIRSRYQRASVRYDEIEKLGQLPTLKIKRRGGRNSERQNDPFAATNSANRRF